MSLTITEVRAVSLNRGQAVQLPKLPNWIAINTPTLGPSFRIEFSTSSDGIKAAWETVASRRENAYNYSLIGLFSIALWATSHFISPLSPLEMKITRISLVFFLVITIFLRWAYGKAMREVGWIEGQIQKLRSSIEKFRAQTTELSQLNSPSDKQLQNHCKNFFNEKETDYFILEAVKKKLALAQYQEKQLWKAPKSFIELLQELRNQVRDMKTSLAGKIVGLCGLLTPHPTPSKTEIEKIYKESGIELIEKQLRTAIQNLGRKSFSQSFLSGLDQAKVYEDECISRYCLETQASIVYQGLHLMLNPTNNPSFWNWAYQKVFFFQELGKYILREKIRQAFETVETEHYSNYTECVEKEFTKLDSNPEHRAFLLSLVPSSIN